MAAKKHTDLTERRIQAILHTWLESRGYQETVTSNFTPVGWYECDVYALTKAGFSWEFEIKVSKKDFLKDAEKGTKVRGWRRGVGRAPGVPKHSLLETRSAKAPNRFSYVVPEGMLDKSDIPSWAGLLEVVPCRWGHTLRQVLAAPQLHREPPHKGTAARMRRGFYYRFWNLLKAHPNPPLYDVPTPLQLLLAAVAERRQHLQDIEDEERLDELDRILDLAKQTFEGYGQSDNGPDDHGLGAEKWGGGEAFGAVDNG